MDIKINESQCKSCKYGTVCKYAEGYVNVQEDVSAAIKNLDFGTDIFTVEVSCRLYEAAGYIGYYQGAPVVYPVGQRDFYCDTTMLLTQQQ